MTNFISKLRSRKAKNRDRQAWRVSTLQVPLPENPIAGFLLIILLWLFSVILIHLGVFFDWYSQNGLFPASVLADSAFMFASMLAIGIALNVVKPGYLRRNSHIMMLALIVLMSLTVAKVQYRIFQVGIILPAEVTGYLLPYALAPLIATLLADGAVGVAAGAWTSICLFIMGGHNFSLLCAGLMATSVTAYLARQGRTRTRLLGIGLLAGMTQLMCVLGQTLLEWPDYNVMRILHRALAGISGGVLSAIIVLVTLPLMELLFRITTDIRLLEVSDLGHPLLQRLAIEAPGTYHHSLVAASLAQAAADEIGANSLLARVCAYFHDIGKLAKPDFFAENIALRNNPHDTLAPSMSSLILASHVKEGISLALLYKLPDPVTAVIREHHGTSLMSSFHHKAKSQMELELGKGEGPGIDESTFRYPGPKPSTRESAIISLADAVEAASRSMEKTSPGHIENLVNDIVIGRFEDGQLDQCDLTLQELTRVKRSFVFTLRNMLHGRVPYPKDENRDKQPAKNGAGEPHAGPDTGRPADPAR